MTAEMDIVERLRLDYKISNDLGFDRAASILIEAADEIERLRAGRDGALRAAADPAAVDAARRIVRTHDTFQAERERDEPSSSGYTTALHDYKMERLQCAIVVARAYLSAATRVAELEAGLTKIAALDDVGANDYLKARGSYGRFDEPGSVQIARETLKVTTP